MRRPAPFGTAIYITRPNLPDLGKFQAVLAKVWESGQLTNMGPQHEAFARRLKEHLGVAHVRLFCNGTLALQLACQVLRLSGEVITTPFTFPATPHVLYWNRIQPVFCDIEAGSFNIDPDRIESMITPQTTAILPVHVFGHPCDTERIQSIADRHGLKVVYDAAHAFGVEVDGRPIGAFGDLSMFSFHATKVFHTVEGGALTYNDPRVGERLDFAKNFGFKNEETIVVPGINAKMNEIQAGLGLLMLEEIEAERERRRKLTLQYRQRLDAIPGLDYRIPAASIRHNYYNLVVTVDEHRYGVDRDHLHDELKRFNIVTRKYFYPLCSQFQCYRQHRSADPANLVVAEKVSRRVLTLPLYGSLRPDDVDRICDVLAYISHRHGRVRVGRRPRHWGAASPAPDHTRMAV